jgi:trans-2,3-dihydro-3-hydroxyanthranilate isomerase
VPQRLDYTLVDVFTDRPLAGNALAVFPHADGLTDSQMQAIAGELNLAETTFVHRSAVADHRLRIFTPGLEMTFAGHPTLGAAWVIAAGRPSVRLELKVGVREARLSGPIVELDTARPEVIRRLDSDELAALAGALELTADAFHGTPAVVSCGTPYLVVPFARIDDLAAVHAGRAVTAIELTGVDLAMFAPGNAGVIADGEVHVRVMSDPAAGPLEDAATGSAAVPICAYAGLAESVSKATHRIVIEQGVEMGRPSRLEAEVDFDASGSAVSARLRGSVVPVGRGQLEVF